MAAAQVLNVGFILYRYTEKLQLLFDEELLSAPEPSCQQLLNYALDRKGCQWSGNAPRWDMMGGDAESTLLIPERAKNGGFHQKNG